MSCQVDVDSLCTIRYSTAIDDELDFVARRATGCGEVSRSASTP